MVQLGLSVCGCHSSWNECQIDTYSTVIERDQGYKSKLWFKNAYWLHVSQGKRH